MMQINTFFEGGMVMSEIRLNDTNLMFNIFDLKALKQEIDSNDKECDAVRGGGSAVQELEKMANNYKQMKSNISVLIGNTIGFMENVNNSFIGNDHKAAMGFR